MKYIKIILYVEVLRLSRRHHKLSFKWKQSKSKENLFLSSSEQDEEKVKSAGKIEKTHIENKKKAILENSRTILENDGAFLRNKKALLGNKRTLFEKKRATPGNKRTFLENKMVILDNKRAILRIKGHFWEVKGFDLRTRALVASSPIPPLQWSFSDVSSKIFQKFYYRHSFLRVRYPDP